MTMQGNDILEETVRPIRPSTLFFPSVGVTPLPPSTSGVDEAIKGLGCTRFPPLLNSSRAVNSDQTVIGFRSHTFSRLMMVTRITRNHNFNYS